MVSEVAAVGHCELRDRLRSCVSTSLTLLNKLKQHRWRKHCVYFHCVLQYVCIVCYCTAYSYIVIDYGSLHSSTVTVPSLCYTRPILFLILLSFPMYSMNMQDVLTKGKPYGCFVASSFSLFHPFLLCLSWQWRELTPHFPMIFYLKKHFWTKYIEFRKAGTETLTLLPLWPA